MQKYKLQIANSICGQSLFEVVFALGIAAIVLVSIVGLSAGTIRTSTYSKNSIQATQMAQETTEWLRGERDRNWATFSARATSAGTQWCLSANPIAWPTGQGSCSTTVDDSIFTRSVTLTLEDLDSNSVADTVDAEVIVSWTDTQGQHNSTNNARFTDWRR